MNNIPTVEELVEQLKQQNPKPGAYVSGFYLTKSKLLEHYEQRIREHAIRLRRELEIRATAEKERLDKLEEAENLRLQDAIARIERYSGDVDYMDLNNEDRKCFAELSEAIAKKPLDKWKPTGKIIFKFWQRLPQPTIQNAKDSEKPVTPAEIRSFMAEVRESQREQIRVMSAVRWVIVGFSIWFIIQFLLMPHLTSER